MSIKQISVFISNKTGRLADITRLLENEKIDIRALSIADTTDYGVLRLIVDDTDKAKAALKNAGLTVVSTDVLAIEVTDTPGAFANAVGALSENGIDLEYAYAFITRKVGKACVILRVGDNEKAEETLRNAGISILNENEIFDV